MKFTIAPDSFKESLSSTDVAEAVRDGVARAAPGSEIACIPMADGGEGTTDALVNATGGRLVSRRVTGPLGGPVDARFGILGDGETAVIEMAAASGLPLVPLAERNPLKTTTFGTGELIKAALDEGAAKIIVGIGGSATVDGGAGVAAALGARFLDAAGKPIPPGGGGLDALDRIDLSDLDERIARASVRVACDVTNPLLGERGAARVFGPQKGATPEMVEILDANMARLARVIERDLGRSVAALPGAGAAGGLGAGLVAFLGAELTSGVALVIEAVGLRDRMRGSDLVITGEGRMDAQSAGGKAPIGVASVAAELAIPVVALCGSLSDDVASLRDAGIDAFFSVARRPADLSECMRNARKWLSECAEEVVRTFLLSGKRPD